MTTMRRPAATPLMVMVMTSAALLHAVAAQAVMSINEPWMRIAPDGRNAEIFLNLRSSEPLELSSADSFAARHTTLVTAAGPTRSIPLAANDVVALKPGESRIRLQGLVRRIRLGEFVPLTLFLRDAKGAEQRVFVNAEVRLRSPTEDEATGHAHGSDAAGHTHPPGMRQHDHAAGKGSRRP